MLIDNFEAIAKYIAPNDALLTEDNFYFCQIISRAKDGGINGTIKDFYITDSRDLLYKKSRIQDYCEAFNARAYFNPNVKSYEKCSLDVLKCLAEVITNKQYSATKGLFNSAAGKISTRDNRFEKVWIVDFDYGDGISESEIGLYLYNNLISYQKLFTKFGIHFLTKPFDLRFCPFADKIQKHNPTLLYYRR